MSRSIDHLDEKVLEDRSSRILEEQHNFRQDLIRQRQHCEMTEIEVAEEMGVSVEAIKNFEHYDANPTMLFIRLYAMAVGADIDWSVIPRGYIHSKVSTYSLTTANRHSTTFIVGRSELAYDSEPKRSVESV